MDARPLSGVAPSPFARPAGVALTAGAGRSVLAARLAAQLLSGPPVARVVDVVDRVLAVQAQDPRGARLAVRARSAGLRAADVDAALTQDRSVVITWVNRGTLHLVRSEDYWWLHDLTTPQLRTGNARRLEQEGVSPAAAERGVGIVSAALSSEGPLTRYELRERVAAGGVRVEGQALVHILLLATLDGLVVRGPMKGDHHAFVLVEDWLGSRPAPVERAEALATLARRYLAGHGPASDRDLARWAGIPLGQARRGLSAIDAELEHLDDGLLDMAGRAPAPQRLPAPRLLGAYEPLLLGWTSREAVVGPYLSLVTVNGLFRPFAMVEGRAVGTWRLLDGKVALEPFESLSRRVTGALEADARAVESFLGDAPLAHTRSTSG